MRPGEGSTLQPGDRVQCCYTLQFGTVHAVDGDHLKVLFDGQKEPWHRVATAVDLIRRASQ